MRMPHTQQTREEKLANKVKSIFMLVLKSHDINTTVVGGETLGESKLTVVHCPEKCQSIIDDLQKTARSIGNCSVAVTYPAPGSTTGPTINISTSLLGEQAETKIDQILIDKTEELSEKVAHNIAKKLATDANKFPGIDMTLNCMSKIAELLKVPPAVVKKITAAAITKRQGTDIVKKTEGLMAIITKASSPDAQCMQWGRNPVNIQISNAANWESLVAHLNDSFKKHSDAFKLEVGSGNPPPIKITINNKDQALAEYIESTLAEAEEGAEAEKMGHDSLVGILARSRSEALLTNIAQQFPSVDMAGPVLVEMAKLKEAELGKPLLEQIAKNAGKKQVG